MRDSAGERDYSVVQYQSLTAQSVWSSRQLPDDAESAKPKHRRWDGRRWMIMVVEDDAALAEASRGVLEDEEYDVISAQDGRAALKQLQTGPIPDLIVLDLRMPVMDGWEFRARQKNDPRLTSIPIIAVSADASPQAVAISADAYLKKPFDSGLLVQTVARVLHQQELKQMSQRLESAERLASLGRLAAGVGHEINNPLAFVMMNVSMAVKRLTELREASATTPSNDTGPATGRLTVEDIVPDVIEMLTESEMGLERIRQTVGRLQKLSRDSQNRHEPFDLQTAIDQSVAMAWTQIQHRARFSKDYRRRRTIVNGDAVAIGQVFLNLLVNAAQAIPEGDADNNQVSVSVEVVDDDIVVTIRDTGAGIAAEHLPHIFEPFYTTKPVGGGTGLGLAIARQTVNDHHGRIEVESAPGTGTTARVYLPFIEALNIPRDLTPPPEPPLPASAQAVPSIHRSRVLVIDDEPMIGRVIQSALKSEHEVVVETRAADALARLDAGESFDLILCDLTMPNITGPDVFAIVSKRWPDLVPRLVFMTGGSFTDSTRAFVDTTSATILSKPFTVDELRKLARARTAAGAPAT